MTSLNLGKWLLLGGISYAFFAIVQLPASVALRVLAPEGAAVSGVSGTAWNGTAAAVVTDIATFSEVRWSLKPWKLVLLKASADVNAKLPGGAIRTEINSALFANSGTAKDLRGVLRLEQIGQSLQLPLVLTGTAGLRFDEIRWSGSTLMSATGEIQLADITESSSNTQLGNFSLLFSPDANDATKGVFSDTEAAFKLNGSVILNADNTYVVDALIEPTNLTPATVTSAIGMFGATRDARGNYQFKSTGSY